MSEKLLTASSRNTKNELEAFETPIKVSNQHSEFLYGESEQVMSLNLVRESPTNNCLANALQRSLSGANDNNALGAPSWCFTDNFTEGSPAVIPAPFSQIPAQKEECPEILVEDTTKMDSNGSKKRPVTLWRTAKKI